MMPASLETMNLSASKFTGGIPAEWASLTNLKELKMVACGLDGAPVLNLTVMRTAASETQSRVHREHSPGDRQSDKSQVA